MQAFVFILHKDEVFIALSSPFTTTSIFSIRLNGEKSPGWRGNAARQRVVEA